MGFKTLKDIPYWPDGHERQKLDLHIPQAAGTDQAEVRRRPLIVYIHGGAFKFGSKESDDMPRRQLDRGFAIASLDYRLSGDAIFPAAVEDCKAAVRWLRAHGHEYNLNTDRIIAWGDSAGAHQCAMLAATDIPSSSSTSTKTAAAEVSASSAAGRSLFEVGPNLEHSSSVQAVVDYYGPTDFLQMDDHAGPNGMKHNPPDSPESLYIGGTITEHPDLVRKANPITYIQESGGPVPPLFIAHGTKDHVVPFHQSVLLKTALEQTGRPVVFHPVEGAGHGWKDITGEQQAELDAATDEFLKDVLNGVYDR